MKKNILFFLLVVISGTQFISMVFGEEFHYDSHKKRDPFLMSREMKPLEQKSQITSIKLEGVIIDPKQKSMAIINGEVLYEGDSVGAFIVKKIEKDGVLLNDGEKEIKIPIQTEISGEDKRSRT